MSRWNHLGFDGIENSVCFFEKTEALVLLGLKQVHVGLDEGYFRLVVV